MKRRWRPRRRPRHRPTRHPPSSSGCAGSSSGSRADPIRQIIELLVGTLLAAGATYFVLLPILRPPLDGEGTESRGDEGEDPDDDLSPQAVALRALKEIEFDRATGKLSDTDYEQLKAKYTTAALAALRQEHGAGSTEQKPALQPLLRAPCSVHGPRPEREAVFCSECGRRLAGAPAFCTRCGTALETDARYCNACGARVAA